MKQQQFQTGNYALSHLLHELKKYCQDEGTSWSSRLNMALSFRHVLRVAQSKTQKSKHEATLKPPAQAEAQLILAFGDTAKECRYEQHYSEVMHGTSRKCKG